MYGAYNSLNVLLIKAVDLRAANIYAYECATKYAKINDVEENLLIYNAEEV